MKILMGLNKPALLRQKKTALAAICLTVLTSCASISITELQSLGSKVTPADVNFAQLGTYAERSRAAYGTEKAIRSKYQKTTRINSPGNLGVRYFLERDDKMQTQIITVRGTANDENFSEDLNFVVLEDQQLKIPVHAGFDRAARAIYADAKPYLNPTYKTYLTGHSLGGAVAALVMIYTIRDGYKVERVATFGQPRFTTAAGVQKLTAYPLVRVVDENDMVPMLPPATAIDPIHGPYEHVGPEVILLEGPHYSYLTSHDATRISIGEFWRTVGVANLKDHKIDNYIKRIGDKTSSPVVVAYNQRENYVAQQAGFQHAPN